jgi:uncharacterized protein YndB with AHSA1/START domain
MTYTLDLDATIAADPADVWLAWTDVDRFTEWDPREQQFRLDGDFVVGTTGWSKQRGNPGGPFTLTAVEPGRRWQATCPLPGGSLTVDHMIEPQGDGQVRVAKRYQVRGPMSLAFRLFFAGRLRRDVPASFTALEQEARRLGGSAPDVPPADPVAAPAAPATAGEPGVAAQPGDIESSGAGG